MAQAPQPNEVDLRGLEWHYRDRRLNGFNTRSDFVTFRRIPSIMFMDGYSLMTLHTEDGQWRPDGARFWARLGSDGLSVGIDFRPREKK